MSEELQTEAAESSTADKIEAAPSAEDQAQVPEQPKVEPETEELVMKRKTRERFDSLTGTIKTQQEKIDRLEQGQNKQLEYADPGAPKSEDFDDEMDFVRADARYQATKDVVGMINDNQTKQQNEQRQFSVQQQINSYNGKVAAVAEKHPDFQQVIGQSMLITQDQMGNHTAATQAILQADNGPAVAFHVASNPQLAMQLNQSDAIQAGMIVARLSDQLSVSPASINNAPPPVGSEGNTAGIGQQPDEFSKKYPDAEFI